MTDYYAGVGSQDTPEHILNIMHHIGAYLATQGWVLRSGAASGADASFEEGAIHGEGEMEIYLPWGGLQPPQGRASSGQLSLLRQGETILGQVPSCMEQVLAQRTAHAPT